MASIYSHLEFSNESDVEQKFIFPLLTTELPHGLGYHSSDVKTKNSLRKLSIDKSGKKKLYYPDYAIVLDGVPSLIIEVKAPGADLEEALREARLYASEINSQYRNAINPCSRIMASDGNELLCGYWDQNEHTINVSRHNLDPTDEEYGALLDFISKPCIQEATNTLLRTLRTSATYVKPVQMLGGKSVVNETVGENSFGANVSIEYKYLFNPESREERTAIVKNAYVTSKRKLSHVAPIDKIIRAAIPPHMIDAKPIQDLQKPDEVTQKLKNSARVKNELCLLIGSVGSGKSTFTDYLRLEALPKHIADTTGWLNINLNIAPLSREKIYKWLTNELIREIQASHPQYDFFELSFLKEIYKPQLDKVERGKAALFEKTSERFAEVIFQEIDRLQANAEETLRSYIDYFYKSANKLLIIVLDNCDKRSRDDQLLMFEVATWLKTDFYCMVFLPLRDTTYDQYRDVAPLDTVIKDLVFRIDPPLLERVIYSRLNYAIREISTDNKKFFYYLPNGIQVGCARSEVGDYLKSIIASLFQDAFFRRMITGLAGRNIRKGLEILLDFCKSGHIEETEILKIRASGGDYKLPNHIVSKILLKGNRRYYSDEESSVKNLFFTVATDPLPNPLVRISSLQWLRNRRSEYGPNRTLGFHQVGDLVGSLQGAGFAKERVMTELQQLYKAGCISSENQTESIEIDDLISLSPAGYVHLDLAKTLNYLSTVSEDSLFRENQPAKKIADNLVGRGGFMVDSRQATLSNAKTLVDYLIAYRDRFLIGEAKLILNSASDKLDSLEDINEIILRAVENDGAFRDAITLETDYPPGHQAPGQIVSVQDYGLFVEFGANGTGLVHKSQFNGLNNDPQDPLETGDWVVIEVIRYQVDHGRFQLKLIDR